MRQGEDALLDLHSHILAGMDDGASSIEEAVRMALQAEATGTSFIVATPHHANGVYTNIASKVIEQTIHMNKVLASRQIPVIVFPGQEIRAHVSLIDDYHKGEILTLAGSSYLLLEMPSSHIPSFMEELIHELKVLGIKPIIAHPERNKEVVDNYRRLEALIDLGAYAQITSHSLSGNFGSKVEQHAWSLCQKGLVHLVANDAHNCDKRGFCLDQTYLLVQERLGEEWRSYFENNALCILEDKEFAVQPVITAKSPNLFRSFTSYFFKR